MDCIDKIYIISLELHQKRRDTIKMDLDSAGFDTEKIEWINAINGNDLDITQCISDGTINDTFYDPYGLLTKSIYGCSISHQLCYKKLINSESDATALILEDDAAITHTLLRLLLPNSLGYTKLIDEIDSIDWEVIMLGGQETNMEYEESGSLLLKKMKKFPIKYAAHSYVVNKEGARKLLENNKSIRFAADVNIHMSDSNLYCTNVSYFIQKMGNMEKSFVTNLVDDYQTWILNRQPNWKADELVSSTMFGDDNNNDMSVKSVVISQNIDVHSVDWESFKCGNDIVDSWANIHLK